MACTPPPVRLAPSGATFTADDYDTALDVWSRDGEDFVDFEGRILIRATWLSHDFRAAQVAYRVETERLTRQDRETLKAEHQQALDDGHTFFVAAHTHEWGWNHLERRPPKGLWRLRMIRNPEAPGGGEAVAPIAIQRLGDEAPEGWFVTGYPWYGIQTPEHKAFHTAYQAKFNDYPRLGSVVGYSAIKSLADGMKKAGSTDTEKLVAAFKGLQVSTPFGPIVYRPEDNQSTMGGYVGRTKNEGGKGVMVNYRYVDGAKVQPSNDEVKKLRPAE